MVLHMDKEFALAVAPLQEKRSKEEKWKVHDVESRRQAIMGHVSPKPDIPDEIQYEIHTVTTPDGFELHIWTLAKKTALSNAASGPAALYLHGGGYIAGTPAVGIEGICQCVLASGVPFFSVDYRLAPEHPYPTPLDDCWTALQWLVGNAELYRIDPARIAIVGESAGGGLAAALALLARDRGHSPPIARQILAYPMLDDRSKEDVALGVFSVWDADSNLTGWTAYLGAIKGTDAVPIYAAPARVDDVKDLPPLYIDVGQLDIFAKECLNFANKFLDSGIEVECHVYPGLSHVFGHLAPNHQWAQQQRANWTRQLSLL